MEIATYVRTGTIKSSFKASKIKITQIRMVAKFKWSDGEDKINACVEGL